MSDLAVGEAVVDDRVDTARWKDLKALAERLVSSPTLAFIGAGSSRRLGYPTWSGLLDQLEDHVVNQGLMSVDELDQLKSDTADDPVWLTSLFKTRMGDDWEAFVSERFERSSAEIEDFHTNLIKIPFRHFLTTNLDEVLEMAHQKVESELPPLVAWDDEFHFNEFLARMNDPTYKRRYVHLHGTAANLRDVVLTDQDYLRRYEDLTTLLRLFAVFSTQSVVFIGFSLSDPDFMSMLRRIRSHGPGTPRHFAFLPKQPKLHESHVRERLRQRYGIIPIFYNSTGPEDHRELDDVIRDFRAWIGEIEAPESRATIRSNVHLALADPYYDRESVDLRMRDAILGGPPRVVSLWGPHGAGKTTLAKRLAARYTDFAGTSGGRFSHVVWISPEHFGIVGSGEAPPGDESLVAGIFCEIASTIGQSRLQPGVNQSADKLIELLSKSPTLIVIDRYHHLRGEGLSNRLRYFLTRIPEKSFVIVTCRTEDDLNQDEIEHTPIMVEDIDERAAEDLVQKFRSVFGGTNGVPVHELVGIAGGRPLLLRWLAAFDELPAGLDELAPQELEGRIFSEIVRRLSEDERILLTTLAVFVISHSRETLQALSGLSASALNAAVDRLTVVGFVDADSVDAPVNLKGVVRDYVVRSDLEYIGDELTSAVSRLAQWAFGQFEDRPEWEQDAALKDELVESLPDLRTAVELGTRFPESASDEFIALLATRVAQLLHREGRWSEAQALAKRIIDMSASDEATIEAKLLLARHLAHEGRRDTVKLTEAQDLIKEAKSEIERKRSADGRLTPRVDARYEALSVKAEMRLGHACASLNRRSARASLESAIEKSRDRFPKIHVDAIGYQAELLVQDGEYDEALDLLEEATPAIVSLGGTRLAAHHAQLRAETYRKRGDLTIARRYFARGLILSQPWSDGRLRARCLYGLADCDKDLEAGKKALEIFQRFGLTREADEIDDLLPEIDAESHKTRSPFVFLVGPPGSGKALVREFVTETMLEWSRDVRLLTLTEVYDTLRSDEPRGDGFAYEHYRELFTADVRSELAMRALAELGQRYRQHEDGLGAVIEFTPQHLERDFEAIGFDLLQGALCLHFTAEREERLRRNRVRTRDWFPEEVVVSFPDRPEDGGFDFLRSHGAAHDEIDARGTSSLLCRRVKDSLALSFAPTEVLEDWSDDYEAL
jgi:tetratricopeptide (TPR) repeat protein